MRRIKYFLLSVALFIFIIAINAKNDDYPYYVPYDANAEFSENPLLGDYAGKIVNESRGYFSRNSNCVAQVYPVDDNKFVIKFSERFDIRSDEYATTTGLKCDKKLIINSENVKGIIQNDSLTGKFYFEGSWYEFRMKKTLRLSPTMGEKALKNAIVLFDGSDYDEWEGLKEMPVKWKIVNGDQMEVVPVKHHTVPTNDILTERKFTDVFLHLEFRLPLMPKSSGQFRGNSGIKFQNVCEVQILDSYGLEGKWRECGALYRMAPPKVNMCWPPLTWQTYDIIYHAPKYDNKGLKINDGEITVYHNGKRIHYKYPLKQVPEKLEEGMKVFASSIVFQDHWYVLWFRNVWAIDLSKNNMLPEFINQLE